jgi:hypothetical protein
MLRSKTDSIRLPILTCKPTVIMHADLQRGHGILTLLHSVRGRPRLQDARLLACDLLRDRERNKLSASRSDDDDSVSRPVVKYRLMTKSALVLVSCIPLTSSPLLVGPLHLCGQLHGSCPY